MVVSSLAMSVLLSSSPGAVPPDSTPVAPTEAVTPGVAAAAGALLGGVAGAVVCGGATFGYGYWALSSGQCQGVGCEGPAFVMAFAPLSALGGAVVGAAGGAVGGFLLAGGAE